jgi:hypothetical protein
LGEPEALMRKGLVYSNVYSAREEAEEYAANKAVNIVKHLLHWKVTSQTGLHLRLGNTAARNMTMSPATVRARAPTEKME